MAEELVTKQEVKDYLDYDNKSLADELKEKIDIKDDWGDFKADLAINLPKYLNAPNEDNKAKIQSIVSHYFSTNYLFATDSINKMIKDIGVRGLPGPSEEKEEKKNSKEKSKRRDEHIKEIYKEVGLETPEEIIERNEEKWKEHLKQKNGYYEMYGPNAKGSKSYKGKSDGIVKRFKSLYYEATATMVNAPGRVPPEILEENKDKLEESYDKLGTLIDELARAKDIESQKNDEHYKDIPDDIKKDYDLMRDYKLTESQLDDFQDRLKTKKVVQIKRIRSDFDDMQNAKLEQKLLEVAKEKFKDMSEEEIEQEVVYVMDDSEIDEQGNLILPKHSGFEEILYNEDGELNDDQADLASILHEYVQTPKVKELSPRELSQLSRNYRDLSKLDPKSKEYKVARFLQDNPDLLPDNVSDLMDEISKNSKEYFATRGVLRETELLHKLIISKDIESQFEDIQDILKQYEKPDDKLVLEYENEKESNENKELTKEEYIQRQKLLKIARKKVNALEKAGLSRVLAKGEKDSKALIRSGREVLISDLRKAREAGEEEFNIEFPSQDEYDPMKKDDNPENNGEDKEP